MSILLVGAMFTFTACGDDDDDDKDKKELGKDGDVKGSVTETDNTVTLTVTKDGSTVEYKASFKNDMCTNANATYTFPSESAAKAAYEDMMNDLDPDEDASVYLLTGKKIIIDMTEQFEGMPKSEIRKIFETILNEIKAGKYDID